MRYIPAIPAIPAILVLMVLMVLATSVDAATYTVHADGSGDFPTIQAAMYAAGNGDVIELGDGVFAGPDNRDLDSNETTFTLASISGDPNQCVINCQGSAGEPHYGIAYSTQGPGAVLRGISIINAWFAPDGGALNLAGASITVQDCRFISNVAQNFGGAVFGNDWSSPSFTNCVFRSNIAYNGRGGAVHLEDNANPLFQSCTFDGNMASSGGALSFDLSCSVEINDCTIEGSVANAIELGTDGDLYMIQSIVAFNQGFAVTGAPGSIASSVCCDVYGNTSGDWVSLLGGQGGMAGNLEADPQFCNAGQGNFTLHSTSPCAAENNPSCGQIGAWPVGCWNVITVAADGSGDYPTIQAAVDAAVSGVDVIELLDGIYYGNGNRDVVYLGKAITIRSQSGNPANCIIDVNAGAGSMHTGFIFQDAEGPESMLQGVTVQDGYGDAGGAVLVDNSSPTLMNCVFRRNVADYGGAIYAESAIGTSRLTIIDCEFVENAAESSSQGGAIYVIGGNLDVTNCRFVDNQAGPDDFITPYCYGGAVLLVYTDDVHFVGCTFTGNRSSDLGGAIVAAGTLVPLVIANCTFYDNAAAMGSAVYVEDGSITISNSILADGWMGGAVAVTYPGVDTITLSCSDVYGNVGGDWTGIIADQAHTSGNISANPQFCDGAAGELTLTASSPCAPFSPPNQYCELIGAYPVGCAYNGVITAVTDVGNDQGRLVRVRWDRSPQDQSGTPYNVESYSLWRRINGAARAVVSDVVGDVVGDVGGDVVGDVVGDVGGDAKMATRDDRYPPGDWDYVTSIPARGEWDYNVICPTLGDSTITNGMFWSTFFVSAETDGSLIFFDSAPDSGYSLDNLAPGVPLNFRLETPTLLAWDESGAADFDYFTIYGSLVEQLDPSAAIIGHTTGLSLEIADPAYPFYLLTATDFAGNEGEAANVATNFTDVNDRGATITRFALHPAWPNPGRSGTTIAFDLPRASRVNLTVYDITGRQVATLINNEMPAGSHAVEWGGTSGTGKLSSGVYVFSLEAGEFRRTGRVMIMN